MCLQALGRTESMYSGGPNNRRGHLIRRICDLLIRREPLIRRRIQENAKHVQKPMNFTINALAATLDLASAGSNA